MPGLRFLTYAFTFLCFPLVAFIMFCLFLHPFQAKSTIPKSFLLSYAGIWPAYLADLLSLRHVGLVLARIYEKSLRSQWSLSMIKTWIQNELILSRALSQSRYPAILLSLY